MKHILLTLIALTFITLACRSAAPTPAPGVTPAQETVPPEPAQDCSGLCIASITTLVELGGNVDWAPDGSLIAYDAPDADGFTGTWQMKPDGTQQKCLTCNNPASPTDRHTGSPTWHPSMQWIVVQGISSEAYARFPAKEAEKKRITDVGVGINNELWAMKADGSAFHQLTDVWGESKFQGGVLHPHFSHDGKKLAWSQRTGPVTGDPGGEWAIKIADFAVEGGTPRIRNIRTYQPGKDTQRLYETHAFSPDDRLLLFSSNSDGQSKWGFDLYTLDLSSEQVTRLTDTPREWDEHAHFSPDGQKIVWISSMKAGSSTRLLKTEIWWMNADGSGQQPLTFFNDPASAMHAGDPYGVVPADISWAPDGKQFAVYVIVNQSADTEYSMPGRIVLVKLK